MPPSARGERRALRSAGVVDGQLVELKLHGLVRWTGLVIGNCAQRPSDTRKTIVRVSWGEAGGEHEQDADSGWILHHDRGLLLKTLTTTYQTDENRAPPRSAVTLATGPPPGCRFLAPEVDFEDLEWLSGQRVCEARFDAALTALRDPLTQDAPTCCSDGALPVQLLYLTQLELSLIHI